MSIAEPLAKFIVIEGIDGSGKATQVELLQRYLKSIGKNVSILDYPAYHTPFGKLVRNYLNGEYGSLDDVPPEVASLLYALDRYQFIDEHFKASKDNDYILANRYIQSNISFQGAKFSDPKKRKEFIDWMVRVEERNLQPDLVIFLDVQMEQSDKNLNKRNLKEGRKNKNDIHEGDMSYMDKVRQMYLEYGKANGWVILDCMDHHTKEMKGILEIQEMIIDTIKTLHSS